MAAAATAAPDLGRTAPKGTKGVQPLRAGEGPFLSLAPPAFAVGNHPDWSIFSRAHRLQLRDLERPPRLRAAGQIVELTPISPRAGVGSDLHPARLPRPLRRLDRLPRTRQRQRLPLGLQLDVHLPARHRPHRVCLHRPARPAPALHGRSIAGTIRGQRLPRSSTSSRTPGCSPST